MAKPFMARGGELSPYIPIFQVGERADFPLPLSARLKRRVGLHFHNLCQDFLLALEKGVGAGLPLIVK